VNLLPESDGRSWTGEARLAELMQGYQRGEADSFEELYSLVSGELRRYIAYLSGDAHRAEDCLQECFMQIHRVRHTYHPARPFRPWAYAIARNVFFMERRSRMRRQRHEYRFPVSDWYLPNDSDRLAHREDLDKALAGLSLEYREALILHHAFGFSFTEIGAMTGTRTGTARARCFRALKQLREEMDGRNV
jgi:RNA polymerase sigma-70 factor (ECF subfamily)